LSGKKAFHVVVILFGEFCESKDERNRLLIIHKFIPKMLSKKRIKVCINDQLPPELIREILCFTSGDHFDQVQFVCKLWYKIYNDPQLRSKYPLVLKKRFFIPNRRLDYSREKKKLFEILSHCKFEKIKYIDIKNYAVLNHEDLKRLRKMKWVKTVEYLAVTNEPPLPLEFFELLPSIHSIHGSLA
jgi:hypothetical protein